MWYRMVCPLTEVTLDIEPRVCTLVLQHSILGFNRQSNMSVLLVYLFMMFQSCCFFVVFFFFFDRSDALMVKSCKLDVQNLEES